MPVGLGLQSSVGIQGSRGECLWNLCSFLTETNGLYTQTMALQGTGFGAELQPGSLRPEYFGEGSRLSRKNISIIFCYWGGMLHLINWFFYLRKWDRCENRTRRLRISRCVLKQSTKAADSQASNQAFFFEQWGRCLLSSFAIERTRQEVKVMNKDGKWRPISSVSPE